MLSLTELRVLLATEVAPAPSSVVKVDLEEAGLIEPTSPNIDGVCYRITEKGHAYLRMVTNTPLPIEQTLWVDPRTDKGA